MPRETRARRQRPLQVFFGGRIFAVPRVDRYQTVVESIQFTCRALSNIDLNRVTLQSEAIPDCEGVEAVISPLLWSEVAEDVGLVKVVLEEEGEEGAESVATNEGGNSDVGGSEDEAAPLASTHTGCSNSPGQIRLNVATRTGKRIPIEAYPNMFVQTVIAMIALVEMGSVSFMDQIKLCTREGRSLPETDTLEDHAIGDGTTIYLVLQLRGGKPVIYLNPPARSSNVHASVDLNLHKSWYLSAIWPVPLSSRREGTSYGRRVLWNVSASPDGTLVDKDSGMNVSYLYWEALTDTANLLSPPPSPRRSTDSVAVISDVSTFDPACPFIGPDDSVLLPCNKIGAYLDNALTGLGLHTEARTSFITYWLPSILKHSYVALRFLPQEEYEQAAELTVKPTPDVVTRVFMLFRGVKESQLADWELARARASEDAAFWRDVVGVDLSAALDDTLFRVLEWGGMEVLG
ncbi:unnamed protein product [Peniophora sp. CBMAI 1063]|nr:unnamed protein product [Peniophora sp. CBMAI 1063]